jgi:hypothetical protein
MTPEQKAIDLLDRMGVPDVQSFTDGDVVELANMIMQRDLAIKTLEQLKDWDIENYIRHGYLLPTPMRKLIQNILEIKPNTTGIEGTK